MPDRAKKAPRPEKEKAPEPEVIKFSGLCSVCVHAPTCAYREAHKEGAIFCEMFDSDSPSEDVKDASRPAVSFRAADSPAEHDQKYQGLCVNCYHRDTCALSTSHGGVWHCEEYRTE